MKPNPRATTDPYMQLLGLETRLVEPGRAIVAARVGPQHTNIHGACHGGFLYSLADAAFALASNAHGVVAVALSTQMQYFKAVQVGEELEAHAREENLGRRTATYRIEVKSGARTVALFIGTVFRMQES